MLKVGCNLRKRRENESALVQARMRKFDGGLVQDHWPRARIGHGQGRVSRGRVRVDLDEQEIEINDARAVALVWITHAPQRALDVEKAPEQPSRTRSGGVRRIDLDFEFGSDIEISTLAGWTTHGFRLMHRAASSHAHSGQLIQVTDSAIDRCLSISEIRAQTDPGVEIRRGFARVR